MSHRHLRTDNGNRPRTVFFDLDSTLCNTSQRHHLINQEDKPSTDWVAFSMACGEDTPFPGAVRLAQLLYETGFRIVILTGRDEPARNLTVSWLLRHGVSFDDLLMRVEGDDRHNPEYKADRIVEYCEQTGAIPELLVDDWPATSDAVSGVCPVVVTNPMYGTPTAPLMVADANGMEGEALYVK